VGERVPDEIFAHPRLAAVYDAFDGDRSDLDHYRAIVAELGATSVLDVGCGTGELACLLALDGVDVVGVDPAAASLAVAARKPGAERVRWIHGDASALPALAVDLAVMTGNVAQVFVDDTGWHATLAGIRRAVRPLGRFVFETRIPARRAWEGWTCDATRQRLDLAGIGPVETWTEVTEVALPLVSFRQTYRFEADGAVLVSHSTLRFRELDELDASLRATGWSVAEVRDAPDRPGREWVVIADAAQC